MGLKTFGLIMLVMNSAFLTRPEADWLISWFGHSAPPPRRRRARRSQRIHGSRRAHVTCVGPYLRRLSRFPSSLPLARADVQRREYAVMVHGGAAGADCQFRDPCDAEAAPRS